MPLHLVPIPPECLEQTQVRWTPFVTAIAERASNDPNEMARMLFEGEAQAFLVWEPVGQKAQAFIGVQYLRSTKGRVGQIIWLMGENRKEWVHLFADLETYLREHQACVTVRAVARPGWTKFLKSSGYRETHVVMERAL
jgi:long-subunit acyl-CoA synthetase (AMP-forming)